MSCTECGTTGKRRGTQLHFGGFDEEEIRQDPLNRIKEAAKRRLGGLYPLAIEMLSPVYTSRHVKRFLAGFDLDSQLVADLGAGPHRRSPQLLCVDGTAYSNVDLVSDLRTLPLVDGALDGAVSIAVLEHASDPGAHVSEMYRVLAPGGRLLCYVPFIQPFHASPYDYQRYTGPGLVELFNKFEVLSVGVGAGPMSGMLWVLQEWLALVLSVGSRRLYRLVAPLTWALSPLKLFDLLLVRHPMAHVIASAFVIEVRRPLT
jgi:SAM-dependent methyltransferase